MIVNPMLFGGTKLPELENPGAAGDLLAGKQLVDQYGNPLTGTMPKVDQAVPEVSIDSNGLITAKATQAAGYVEGGSKSATKQLAKKSASDLTASGPTVTVPAGYYPKQVSFTMATPQQATPSISVSSNGLITASATQSAGYVSAGTKSATKQLSTVPGGTFQPRTYTYTAVSSGCYLTGSLSVQGDGNLKAENIKAGVSIFGVTGTAASTTAGTITIRNNSDLVLNVYHPNSSVFRQAVADYGSGTFQTIVGFRMFIGFGYTGSLFPAINPTTTIGCSCDRDGNYAVVEITSANATLELGIVYM